MNAMPAGHSTCSSVSPRSTSSRVSSRARNGIWTRPSSGAPADGYVTNLALRKGARVANLPLSPVMAFIDTSSTIIGVEINQIDARYVEPGQEVELTFKFAPGTVYSGKVESVLQAIATGQAQASGTAVMPKALEAVPFVVRVKLDDDAFAGATAGRLYRHGRDLHRTPQADPYGAPRAAAAGGDYQLRQSVLTERPKFKPSCLLLTPGEPR